MKRGRIAKLKGADSMASTREIVLVLSLTSSGVAFRSTSVEASFIYEVVPFVLTEAELEWTISGTIETDCNDCVLNARNVVGFDILVDPPFEGVGFRFQSLDIDAYGYSRIVPGDPRIAPIATPTTIILPEPGNLVVEPLTRGAWLRWNLSSGDVRVEYFNANQQVGPGYSATAISSFVVATLVPEPSALSLCFAGFVFLPRRLR
jgi:hypothetical protein